MAEWLLLAAAIIVPSVGGMAWLAFNRPVAWARLYRFIYLFAARILRPFSFFGVGVSFGVLIRAYNEEQEIISISIYGLGAAYFMMFIFYAAIGLDRLAQPPKD